MNSLSTFIANVVKLIVQPLLGLLFALAILFFGAGLAAFFFSGDDPKVRQKTRSILIWGVIGFFIMVSAVAIISVVTNTFCGKPFCKLFLVCVSGKGTLSFFNSRP